MKRVDTRFKRDETTQRCGRRVKDVDMVEYIPHRGRQEADHCTDVEKAKREEGRWHWIGFKMTDKWDPDFMGCNRRRAGDK